MKNIAQTTLKTCILLLAALLLKPLIAFAETKQTAKIDAELIDDSVQVNRMLSLRSLATGVSLANGQYSDRRNLVWTINEVPAEKTLFSHRTGLTQFHAFGMERCLYTIQNRIITANCDPIDPGSLWQIIPTVQGGVQIKSLRSDSCLSAGNSYSDFRLAPCQESETVPASVKLLWIFAPPAVEASLSPALPTGGK